MAPHLSALLFQCWPQQEMHSSNQPAHTPKLDSCGPGNFSSNTLSKHYPYTGIPTIMDRLRPFPHFWKLSTRSEAERLAKSLLSLAWHLHPALHHKQKPHQVFVPGHFRNRETEDAPNLQDQVEKSNNILSVWVESGEPEGTLLLPALTARSRVQENQRLPLPSAWLHQKRV